VRSPDPDVLRRLASVDFLSARERLEGPRRNHLADCSARERDLRMIDEPMRDRD